MKRFAVLIKNGDLLISGAALIVLVAITSVGVFMRYVLSRPFPWQEEVQLWCYVWLSFFGGSVAFRHGGHVAIEVLVDLFPHSLQRVVKVLIYLVVTSLLVYITVNGFRFVTLQYEIERTTNVLHFPYYIICLALPIGCILMIISWTFWTLKGGEPQ